jgi:hypothetical protein
MTAPSPNGRPTDPPRPAPPPERGGFTELLGEAEALRALLGEAATRSARLLAALKQRRRQNRALEAAVASLRDLRLDR